MGPSIPSDPFPPAPPFLSPPIEMDAVSTTTAADGADKTTSATPTSLPPHPPESPSRPPLRVAKDTTTPKATRSRRASSASASTRSFSRRLSTSFQESDVPRGFFAATADMSSSVLVSARSRSRSNTGRTRSSTLSSSDTDQQTRSLQRQKPPATNAMGANDTLATLDEHGRPSASFSNDDDKPDMVNNYKKESTRAKLEQEAIARASTQESPGARAIGDAATADVAAAEADLYKDYRNGYHFPPKYPKGEAFGHGLRAFWDYTKTPLGFCVVVYGLNIVAWGGMIFLLLCNASPAMCHPSCNDINSPRRKWIEYDAQILTALFCVTGFGLAPWRFRDLYFLLQYYMAHNELGLRRLGGVYRGWVRLPGSDKLSIDVGPGNVPPDTPVHAIPYPETKVPDVPLTGERAPPTKMWRIVFIIGMNVSNTVLQAVLSGIMWGMNRYTRPSWATGLFVGLGCVAGALGGLGMFMEGKRVKSIEGVPLTDKDREKLAQDEEQGIHHYNNIKDKKPKDKAKDEKAGQPLPADRT
ncbi:hypothetical protein SPI_06585 [Niveomyces insectorum RCEF 264]|uniref:Alpha-l-rhamnosidase c n=1 Tax=Niveomyces insectorum RCEF 264 TaxID=1081102 RepID=A0A167REB1_9HYPO|nr:hypothetical protein SPI_06585 [Niveomyces insectorum RCEF 264]